jgi:preprotein translocase SecF subunit
VIPRRKIYISISVVLMVIGFLAIPFRGMNFGIDFTGGNVYQVKFESTPSVADIRASVSAQGLSDPRVQTVGAAGENRLLVYLPGAENDSTARDLIQNAVGSALIEQEDTVGPSVGSELRTAAIWSILASMILIILYIWLRFGRNGLGYGIGGVLGVLHDAIVTIGLFTLFGLEFNLQFIAAVLTIIGYSMNDSIIIFDRIRELTGLASLKESFATRVSLANNQTFSRGVITHVTTFFTVAVLAVLGGSSLRDFAVAMCIGVAVGAYSSISVASPFVAWWDSRRVKVPANAKK